MAKSDSKEDTKMDMAQDKAMVKKAFKMHDKQEHKGEKTDLSALKKGGKIKKMCGGKMVKKMAAGGIAKDMPSSKKMGSLGLKNGGCAKMAKGGYVRAADGVASKGKTKGKIV